MEHTYTDSAGRWLRYADGGVYQSRRGEAEVFFSILDDRDREILRLAEREQKLRASLSHLVAAASADDWEAFNEAREAARALLKEE